MTQAVSVRRDGDLYQARFFWLKACELLFDNSAVEKVGFETGPKSFDDVMVTYKPGRGPRAADGQRIEGYHFQCKWHSTPGSFGYADLVEPKFINAQSTSLLERAYSAVEKESKASGRRQFKLITNWQLSNGDPLARAISSRFGFVRADRLAEGKTDRSAMGAVRKTWREHLGIDDAALLNFAPSFGYGHTGSLDDLRDQMDSVLFRAGLQMLETGASAAIYDELIFAWLSQGRVEFTATELEAALADEDLVRGAPKASVSFGVKSFHHAFDVLEDRCNEVLDLTPHFEERFIRESASWHKDLFPPLKSFLARAASKTSEIKLALDAHSSLAFAAGAVLDNKSGRRVSLEQRVLSKEVWSADDAESPQGRSQLSIDFQRGTDIVSPLVVMIGLTHNISAAVRNFIHGMDLNEAAVLTISLPDGPSNRSVKSGAHAFQLAGSAAAAIRDHNPDRKPVHLFIAAPNGFSFFLGQHHAMIEPLQLYEYDFEGSTGGSYLASLSLPRD